MTEAIQGIDPFDAIRVYIDARLRDADQRHQERFDFAERAAGVADQRVTRRLDALAASPTREEVNALINPVRDSVSMLSRTNWPLIASTALVVLSVISGSWVIVGLKIEAASQPMRIAIETTRTDIESMRGRLTRFETAGIETFQALSTADRGELREAVRRIEANRTKDDTEYRAIDAENKTNVAEIAQRLAAFVHIMNVTQDRMDQMLAILYGKVFDGDRLPPTPYRPAPGR